MPGTNENYYYEYDTTSVWKLRVVPIDELTNKVITEIKIKEKKFIFKFTLVIIETVKSVIYIYTAQEVSRQ